jgi:hypothetical protein
MNWPIGAIFTLVVVIDIDNVSGDPSLQVDHPYVGRPSTKIPSTTLGELKWILACACSKTCELKSYLSAIKFLTLEVLSLKYVLLR